MLDALETLAKSNLPFDENGASSIVQVKLIYLVKGGGDHHGSAIFGTLVAVAATDGDVGSIVHSPDRPATQSFTSDVVGIETFASGSDVIVVGAFVFFVFRSTNQRMKILGFFETYSLDRDANESDDFFVVNFVGR